MHPMQLLAAVASMAFAQSVAASTALGAATAASADLSLAADAPATTLPVPTVHPGLSNSALTKTDVDAWLDGFMPYALRQGDVAGAIVVVVKDGQVLTLKGFGYSNVAERKPVNPERTLFRPGSVSKLFTWTAVMQQVEQGKLDLDADVNEYLDFEIPARSGKPLTLRNMLTHTPGFEEQLKGVLGVESDGVAPLDTFLKRWIPVRIFAPGQTPAYSNYAAALAGYIVARVSGTPFDDYLDKYVFEPLDMDYSTFRQPLPGHLKAHMSKGYSAASLPSKPFEIVGPAPAGSLSTSGADMAHFMIAHLQKGRYGNRKILAPATAELMHGTALTLLPRVNRMLLGFWETNYNGRRIIGHGGDTQWFHSYLHLFIDDGVGLFVGVNSTGKDGAARDIRAQLFHEFADRYLPGPAPDGNIDAQIAAEHARMIAGRYANSRRSDSSFLSLLNLLSEVTVIDNGDGTIGFSMARGLSGAPPKWREIAPFVWKQDNSETILGAKVENGRVTRFSFDDVSPFMAFVRPAPSTSAAWLLPSLLTGLIALSLASIAWPVSVLTRRYYGAQYELTGQDAVAHRCVRIAAFAVVIVFAAWAIVLMTMMSNFNLSARMDALILALQILGTIAFVGGAAVGLWNLWVVLRNPRSWYAKISAMVLALSFLVVLWVSLAFHLISFGTNF